MTKYQTVRQPFSPVFDEESRILILGSFPSVKSRETGFYYGHPRNRFWRVLAYILKCEVPTTVESKKKMLISNRIALYDVIESCRIIGSGDSSIKDVVPADIKQIVESTDITAVFTNGKTASKLYNKYQAESVGIPTTELPSTSPANAAYSLEKLTEIWSKKIKEYL